MRIFLILIFSIYYLCCPAKELCFDVPVYDNFPRSVSEIDSLPRYELSYETAYKLVQIQTEVEEKDGHSIFYNGLGRYNINGTMFLLYEAWGPYQKYYYVASLSDEYEYPPTLRIYTDNCLNDCLSYQLNGTDIIELIYTDLETSGKKIYTFRLDSGISRIR